MITSGLNAHRSTGATVWMPSYLPYLARAYADLGQFDAARRCIGEAMTAIETTKERWCEAEVNRIAGEIARRSPAGDLLKAQAYFERALTVARQQQAKSWELRAAMSMAGSGAIGARRRKLTNCSLRSMAGLPKASTRST
jgi:predicted ATPase